MTRSELGGPILAAVSRSFYLSIRLLPSQLRAPIGLAYLLARASDTIADSASASPALRLQHLAAFEAMIQTGGSGRNDLPALVADLQAGCTPAERTLLGQIGPCLDWLEALDTFDQVEIRAVLRQIIHGQRLDLERFGSASPENVIALLTAAELEDYTYLVAGCVGEFWTRCCVHWLPGYSPLELAPLCEMGREFGQGLQLVNILRDLPADLRQGRCYLPEVELAAVGAPPAQLPDRLSAAKPVFHHWLQRGRQLLIQGNRYLNAISSRRARLACWLPCSIGLQTLALLERQAPWEATGRLKVSRAAVRRTLLTGLLPVLTGRPLHERSAHVVPRQA